MSNIEMEQPSVEELKEIEVDNAEQDFTADVSDSDYAGSIDSFKLFLREIGRYKLLTPEQEIAYAKKYRAGDEEAKQVLVNHNLRLVVNIAKHYIGRGIELPDLVQEGCIGLMKGVEMFDVDLGFKLSTYCTWWIRQAITRYISNSSRAIRLPVHVNDKLYKYTKFVATYSNEHNGDMPSDEEISKHLDFDISSVKQLIDLGGDLVSLDARVGTDGDQDNCIGDFIPDTRTSTEEDILAISLRADLDALLADLPDREAEVLRLRFGLDDDRPRTLEEVGQVFNVTRERIRQIEAKAIRKLRHPKKIRQLAEYMPGCKAPDYRK